MRESTPVYTVATWGRLAILLWHRTPTVDGIARTVAVMKDLASRRREGVALLMTIPTGYGRPDVPTRDAMVNAMKEQVPGLRGRAIIYGGDGFIASVIRSVFSGLQMLASSPVPMRVFHNVEGAAPWLAWVLDAPEYTEQTVSALLKEAQRGIMPAATASFG